MHQSVHLAIVQFKPRKGDYAGNLAHLGEIFAQLDSLNPRPQVAFLPETAVSGYFLEGGVRDHAVTAGTLVRDLDEQYRAAVPSLAPMDVGLGFYEVWNNSIYNSALYVTLGGESPIVRHVHRKVFLPTYGMFDEERFVDRGRELRAFDTSWGRAALLVCEDAWHSLSGTIAALDGAQTIFLLAAPPARGAWPQLTGDPTVPASVNRWERLARDIAEEHGVHVVLSNLVGSEGGKIFPGASMVLGPKGELRARGPLWEEALVTAVLDPDDVTRARADMPLIADLEVMVPHLVANIQRIEARISDPVRYDLDGGEPRRTATADSHGGQPRRTATADSHGGQPRRTATADSNSGAVKVVSAGPFAAPSPLEINPKLTEDWLVHFIKDEMAR